MPSPIKLPEKASSPSGLTAYSPPAEPHGLSDVGGAALQLLGVALALYAFRPSRKTSDEEDAGLVSEAATSAAAEDSADDICEVTPEVGSCLIEDDNSDPR